MLFTAVLRLAVKRFGANAEGVKDKVFTKVRDKKGRGGGARRRPEKGRGKPQETVLELQPIWGMLYADNAGIVPRSRNIFAKMIADIAAECGSFGLTVSEAKMETMCLMAKRTYG